MTQINLMLADQRLIVAQKVKIAAGDINSVIFHADFDGAWDNFTERKAIFSNNSVNSGKTYDILLVGNECVVPHEVLEKDGVLSISICGYTADGETRKTSSVAKMKVSESLTDAITTVAPTMDLYMQYLAAINDRIAPAIEAVSKSIDERVRKLEQELEGDVLWENPDTTVALNPTTININTEGYKRYVATFAHLPGEEVKYCTPGFFESVWAHIPANYSSRREISIKDGVLTIGSGYLGSSAGDYIIIGQIIGYKY